MVSQAREQEQAPYHYWASPYYQSPSRQAGAHACTWVTAMPKSHSYIIVSSLFEKDAFGFGDRALLCNLSWP